MASAGSILAESFRQLAALDDGEEQKKAIQYMIFMCGCHITEFVSHCLHTLVELSYTEETGLQIIQQGAIRPLIQICGRATDATVLGHAAGALANLALNVDCIPNIITEGAVRPLVGLCSRSQDATVLGNCAQVRKLPGQPFAHAAAPRLQPAATRTDPSSRPQALRNLAIHEESRPQIVQGGALQPLILLLTNNQHDLAVANAAGALANLSLHEDSGPQIVTDGAVRPLVNLCSRSTVSDYTCARSTDGANAHVRASATQQQQQQQQRRRRRRRRQ
jgi:hypothetical protein